MLTVLLLIVSAQSPTRSICYCDAVVVQISRSSTVWPLRSMTILLESFREVRRLQETGWPPALTSRRLGIQNIPPELGGVNYTSVTIISAILYRENYNCYLHELARARAKLVLLQHGAQERVLAVSRLASSGVGILEVSWGAVVKCPWRSSPQTVYGCNAS